MFSVCYTDAMEEQKKITNNVTPFLVLFHQNSQDAFKMYYIFSRTECKYIWCIFY